MFIQTFARHMVSGPQKDTIMAKLVSILALISVAVFESVFLHAQDQFDIDVCKANVDEWARDQCLAELGVKGSPAPTAPQQQTSASWAELAEENFLAASFDCKKGVERLAKYQFEWTDGWLETKFTRRAPGKSPKSVIYIGDAIKLQNGFGAWQQYLYACEFDTSAKKVIDVSAAPGRLD